MAGKLTGLSRFEKWQMVKPHIIEGKTRLEIATIFEVSKSTINDIKRIGEGMESEDFPVENGKYILRKGDYQPEISFIDEIFGMYSENGLDWSTSQVIQEKGITGNQWYSIIRHFGLTKKCNILSPETWKKESGNKADIISRVLNNLNEKYESKIIRNKSLSYTKNRYNKVIRKEVAKDSLMEDILSNIYNLFVDSPPKTYKIQKEKTKGDVIVASTADIHLGAYREGEFSHSMEDVERKLDKLARKVNAKDAKKVHLIIAGDIIESFMGDNHPNSWMGMEEGMYGARVVQEAHRILCEFIAKIQNVESVNCVPGNHDRGTGSNKIDCDGHVGLIIYNFVKMSFPKLKFNIDKHCVSFKTGRVGHVVFHGHTGAAKKAKSKNISEAERIAYRYGLSEDLDFTIVYTAHYHEFKVFAEDTNFMSLCIPSIFAGNDYSDRGGWSTLPGALITTIDEGLPNIERLSFK